MFKVVDCPKCKSQIRDYAWKIITMKQEDIQLSGYGITIGYKIEYTIKCPVCDNLLEINECY